MRERNSSGLHEISAMKPQIASAVKIKETTYYSTVSTETT
jgi:hypothetical protein